MGLDITAYSQLTRIGDRHDDPADGQTNLYVNRDFPQVAEGLTTGLYTFGTAIGFRAGSYSGYNEWRDMLARLILGRRASECFYGKASGQPFAELIDFSDCEGVIGPRTAAKLFKDFTDHQATADATDTPYFTETYNRFRDAFELASKDGAVCFH